jgi:PPOX class probable FMN-dependent enzyme
MIESEHALRLLYPAPKERAVRKQIGHLDRHCLRFIGLSPFVILASGNREGQFDASPRGGAPGFVKAPDARTLQIPDAPGNNRLDTLENILSTGSLGLLFLIPGVDETLRVNGKARLRDDTATLAPFANEKRTPKLIIEMAVEHVYLHCAKALLRSKLWSTDSQVDRAVLPTAGQMLSEQTGIVSPPETREQMIERYKPDL